jgi:hypothetical protein
MTDCPNAEMRDRLPDLLHERLDASVRAVVLAHVDGCDDCRAELTLLRESRDVLSPRVRAVDVIAISRVVIEKTRPPVHGRSRRSPWMDWRIAASAALLVVGAGSVGLFLRSREAPPSVAAVASRPVVAPNATPTPVAAEPSHGSENASLASATSAELSAAAPVADLSESDLRALLQELDQIDAVPAAEPEQVNVRVSLPGNGSSE